MKKPNRLTSILFAVCELIVGILLLIDPDGFTKSILVVLGAILTAMGIYNIIQYFRATVIRAAAGKGILRGCLSMTLGIFCIADPSWLLTIFPVLTVIYGVVILIAGFSKLQQLVDLLRMKTKRVGALAVSTALTLVFAFVILLNPFATMSVLWKFIGITLIVEAAADIVAACLMRYEENEII